jgi:hypothetical protein
MKITSEADSIFGTLQDRVSEFFGANDPVSQEEIDKCANISLSNSADIASLFSHFGGFIKWYNTTLSNKPEFRNRGAIGTSALISQRFNTFWDQIPAVFGAPATSAIEFAALMSIGIQENSGDLWSNPEEGHRPEYPGLIYEFEAIPNVKSSYNVNRDLENRTAYKLF